MIDITSILILIQAWTSTKVLIHLGAIDVEQFGGIVSSDTNLLDFTQNTFSTFNGLVVFEDKVLAIAFSLGKPEVSKLKWIQNIQGLVGCTAVVKSCTLLHNVHVDAHHQ